MRLGCQCSPGAYVGRRLPGLRQHEEAFQTTRRWTRTASRRFPRASSPGLDAWYANPVVALLLGWLLAHEPLIVASRARLNGDPGAIVMIRASARERATHLRARVTRGEIIRALRSAVTIVVTLTIVVAVAAQFRADDPQVIHVLAAHRAQAGNH